jgi:hypothetical protein
MDLVLHLNAKYLSILHILTYLILKKPKQCHSIWLPSSFSPRVLHLPGRSSLFTMEIEHREKLVQGCTITKQQSPDSKVGIFRN